MQRNHKIDEKREELYSLKVTFVLNMTRVKLNTDRLKDNQ